LPPTPAKGGESPGRKDITPPDMLKTIYNRNLEKYGDKLGPTIDWLREQGKSWEDIIESASKPGGKDVDFLSHGK
jgi:hypothetical protein